jgi:hypothetical protein
VAEEWLNEYLRRDRLGEGQEQILSPSKMYINPVAMNGKTKPKVSKPTTRMAVIPPGLMAAV